jgi:F-type H+-transporting ATPase subunit a
VVKLVVGITLIMIVVGLALGAIGAAIIPVPELQFIPPVLFHLGPIGVTNTMLSAWLTTVVVVLLFVAGTRRISLVPGRMQSLIEMLLEGLYGLIVTVIGERYARRVFPFFVTIFIFVAFNAWMALLPFYPTLHVVPAGGGAPVELLRSAGTDINMPLSLAIAAFLFFEVWGFRAHGVAYLKMFFRLGTLFRGIIHLKPGEIFSGVIDAFVGFLEGLSHLLQLVSLTFRLFGNMLAGEVVILMMTFLTVFIIPIFFYGLELVVGGVQALIFMLLPLVFTLMAVSSHEEEEVEEATAH